MELVNTQQMDVYNIYTNTCNHVARGSLLSDTIITKILIISYFADLQKMRIVNSSAKTVSGHVFALFTGWFQERTVWKSRTLPTHCCAMNDKIECYWWKADSSLYLNLMCTPILKTIFVWKRCTLDSRKYGINTSVVVLSILILHYSMLDW